MALYKKSKQSKQSTAPKNTPAKPLKVLCFTASARRPKMLRGCVRDIQAQTYPHVWHGVNFGYFEEDMFQDYPVILDDLSSASRLKVVYNKNDHQHINHLNAIRSIENFEDFDVFIKVDDDDIYKSDYVKNIVEFMSKNGCDICSSKVKWELNGFNLYRTNVANFGANPEGTDFNMPPSFAFNRRALQVILDIENYKGDWEDKVWREHWQAAGLTHMEVDNTDQLIWHVHGKNISTSSFLKVDHMSFQDLFKQITDAYEKLGKHKNYMQNIWIYEGNILVFDTSINDYLMAFDVSCKNLINLELEVFDRARQLNLLKGAQAFDFTTGEKLKLQELNVNEPKRAEMIVDAIDAFIEEVIASSK